MSGLVLPFATADAASFGAANLKFRHTLASSPLFSDERLMRLIERTSRENYHVNTPGPGDGSRSEWREGAMDGMSGEDVFRAVANGALWVHLQRVGETDPAYADLLDTLFAEIEDQVPGLKTYRRSMSVLISSPDLRVAYHCDVPGQMLWQVRGRKTLYIYPPRAPFLPQEALERIVLRTASDTELTFDPSFEEHASAYELTPGDAMHWPLNGPHRVVNGDCVNISFTTEHWTNDLRAQYAANYANGLLRRAFGTGDLSRKTSGLAFGAKLALAGMHKYVANRRRRPLEFEVDFRVDPDAPAGVRDVPASQISR